MKGLEPSRDCSRCHLKAVRLPIPPHPHVSLSELSLATKLVYCVLPLGAGACFAAGAAGVTETGGAGVRTTPGAAGAGAGFFPGAAVWPAGLVTLSKIEGAALTPPRFARIDKISDVHIKTPAAMAVHFERAVAAPRGPKTVCDAPPKAPAKSAALPLCSSTTPIRNRHTRTWIIVNRIPMLLTTSY